MIKLETAKKYDSRELVYIVHLIGTNYVKIGYTAAFRSRMRALNAGVPYEIEVVAIYENDNEYEIQQIVNEYRHKGDWFEVEVNTVLVQIGQRFNNILK